MPAAKLSNPIATEDTEVADVVLAKGGGCEGGKVCKNFVQIDKSEMI